MINLTALFPVKAKMVTAHKNLSQGKVDKPGNKVRTVKAAKRVHRAAGHLAKAKTYSRVKVKLGKVKQAREKMVKANPDKAKRKLDNLAMARNKVKVVGVVDLRKTYKINWPMDWARLAKPWSAAKTRLKMVIWAAPRKLSPMPYGPYVKPAKP